MHNTTGTCPMFMCAVALLIISFPSLRAHGAQRDLPPAPHLDTPRIVLNHLLDKVHHVLLDMRHRQNVRDHGHDPVSEQPNGAATPQQYFNEYGLSGPQMFGDAYEWLGSVDDGQHDIATNTRVEDADRRAQDNYVRRRSMRGDRDATGSRSAKYETRQDATGVENAVKRGNSLSVGLSLKTLRDMMRLQSGRNRQSARISSSKSRLLRAG